MITDRNRTFGLPAPGRWQRHPHLCPPQTPSLRRSKLAGSLPDIFIYIFTIAISVHQPPAYPIT